jgi:ABC-type microcin C transport system permease subunit YejB
MSSYLLRRLMISVLTLLIIVTIAFFMMRVAPGGPFAQGALWRRPSRSRTDRSRARSASVVP